jgi:hypothetical protein
MSKITPTRKTTVIAEGQQIRMAFYEPAPKPQAEGAITIRELPARTIRGRSLEPH